MFPPDLTARAAALLDRCREAGLKIATAESCTGGLIAGLLTEIPGSSAVVERGFVVYSNDAKEELLGVPAETLATHGAVSEATARALAEGALKASRADIAVSVTGIAGPDGGSAEKPVGLVWFGCARRAADRSRAKNGSATSAGARCASPRSASRSISWRRRSERAGEEGAGVVWLPKRGFSRCCGAFRFRCNCQGAAPGLVLSPTKDAPERTNFPAHWISFETPLRVAPQDEVLVMIAPPPPAWRDFPLRASAAGRLLHGARRPAFRLRKGDFPMACGALRVPRAPPLFRYGGRAPAHPSARREGLARQHGEAAGSGNREGWARSDMERLYFRFKEIVRLYF